MPPKFSSALVFACLCAGPTAADAQSADEIAFLKGLFTALQPISIDKNREYCGYVGFDAAGHFTASPAKRGSKDGCTPDDPTEIEVITASYHTHAAYVPGYASETPSVDDIEADEAEGIDGWVATPGGRLWYIDTEDMDMFMVCDLGCLPADPAFDPADMGPVEDSYSYDELVTYFEE